VLVRATDEGALVIGQLSHAWIAGQLARAWGNERAPGAEPFEEVVLGAEQHDIGWSSFDLQPPLNRDSGLPRNFLELSVEEHLTIWRTAPERLLSQSAHAALVVSMHGSSLSQLRLSAGAGDEQALRAHVDEEHARQAALCRALDVSEAHAERTRRQMWTWDGLSLALCMGWRPFTSKDVPARDGLIDIELRDAAEGGSTLDPWPLAAGRLEVRCEARELTRRYDDEEEMHRALAQARPKTLTFVLARA
jgi:Protein of unknown function (DUF3891)